MLFRSLNDALPEKRAYLKKVHIPVVLHVAQLAHEKGMDADEFGLRLNKFFENLSNDGEYMSACRSGSAKRSSVQTRAQLMSEILEGSAPERKEVLVEDYCSTLPL